MKGNNADRLPMFPDGVLTAVLRTFASDGENNNRLIFSPLIVRSHYFVNR